MNKSEQWNAEVKYRDLFINNPMPMWIYDRETKAFLEVNEEAIKHYGYTRQEFLSMTINDIRPEEDISKLNNLERIKTEFSSIYSGSWRHYNKNGDLMYVEVTSHLLDYENRSAALVLINNITDKVRAEQLKEFERRDKEALINNTEDMMWSVSKKLKLKAANKAFIENAKILLGVDLVPGDSLLLDSLPPEIREHWEYIYNRALNGEIYEEEFYTQGTAYRQERWLDIRFNPISDNNEIKGVACYARDITERKKNEEALKQSNERYNLISKATSDMVWDVNLLTGEVYRNPEGWKKIFGSEKPNLDDGNDKDWENRVHPDDREKLVELMKDLESSIDKNFFELVCRVLRDNGTYAYIIDRGYVIRNEEGLPVRLTGATRDITEKKEAEEKLRLAEEKKQHEITEAVIAAQENERHEIGRELHDNINQILATIRLYLGLINTQTDEDITFKDKVDELIATAIKEVRILSHALIAPSLGKTKLTEAINLLLDTVGKTSGLTVHKEFNLVSQKGMSENLKLNIYRITQEQLNNILKYAKAKNVYVKLVQQDGTLKFSIKDDGIGFNTSKKSSGVGLMNIKARASLFKGKVKIISSEGNGCELKVSFLL